MARVKTFFIYLLLVIAFFIFSQIMIYIAINTTYKYKKVEVKTTIPIEIEVQATSINGFAKGKINNDRDENIQNQYLKIECYSKNNILMGTKNIKIDEIKPKEEKEFEVRFNFSKVDRAVIDIIDESQLNDNIQDKDKVSDEKLGLAAGISALILLYFI